jgi:hypothetical protein
MASRSACSGTLTLCGSNALSAHTPQNDGIQRFPVERIRPSIGLLPDARTCAVIIVLLFISPDLSLPFLGTNRPRNAVIVSRLSACIEPVSNAFVMRRATSISLLNGIRHGLLQTLFAPAGASMS